MVSVQIPWVIKSGGLSNWARTVLIGVIGGIPFGLIIQFWMGNMIDVGAMYGDHSVVRGWSAHLLHSIVGAIVFTGIVTNTRLKDHVTAPLRKTAFGIAYGLILWFVFIMALLPVWLGVMTQWGGGTPFLDIKSRFPASVIGFLVYGLIVAWGVQVHASADQNQDDGAENDPDKNLDNIFESGFIWNNNQSDDKQ